MTNLDSHRIFVATGQRGITLVELMIAVAVLSILAAIAIPLYEGYVREGHYAAMRSTFSGLRNHIEDYRLENPSYVGADAEPAVAQLIAEVDKYSITVSPGTNTYAVWATFNANPDIWTRCDNRMNRCCDSDTGTAANQDCPDP